MEVNMEMIACRHTKLYTEVTYKYVYNICITCLFLCILEWSS
jgi:hypothetical protein